MLVKPAPFLLSLYFLIEVVQELLDVERVARVALDAHARTCWWRSRSCRWRRSCVPCSKQLAAGGGPLGSRSVAGRIVGWVRDRASRECSAPSEQEVVDDQCCLYGEPLFYLPSPGKTTQSPTRCPPPQPRRPSGHFRESSIHMTHPHGQSLSGRRRTGRSGSDHAARLPMPGALPTSCCTTTWSIRTFSACPARRRAGLPGPPRPRSHYAAGTKSTQRMVGLARARAKRSCGSKGAIRSSLPTPPKRSPRSKRPAFAYEIVPGITAALAVGSYAGIPLTQGDAASAVALVTGHERDDKPTSSLDYRGAGRVPGHARVLYGRHHRRRIGPPQLLAAGKSARHAAAIVRRCSLARPADDPLHAGRPWPQKSPAAGLRPPALVIVGASGRARAPRTTGSAQRPLFGTRVLVTRSAAPGSEPARQRWKNWGPKCSCSRPSKSARRTIGARRSGIERACPLRLAGVLQRQRRASRARPPAWHGRDLRALAGGEAGGHWAWHGRGAGDATILRADLVPDEYRAEALAAALSEEAASGKPFPAGPRQPRPRGAGRATRGRRRTRRPGRGVQRAATSPRPTPTWPSN